MEADNKSVIMTRPFFDVYSISIHPSETKDSQNPLSDGQLCHIYGTVKVCDQFENVYHLYNREEDNPDIIKLDGDITLTGFPVLHPKVVTVSVYIYDISHQAEISNDTFVLDYTSEYPYDKLRISKVKGQYGFAIVRHATFLHAFLVYVEKLSLKKEDGGSGELFGSVVASLERDDGEEYASAVLFNNGPKHDEFKPVPVKFNTRVELFRSFVAVPVFCTLVIKVEFDDENGGSRINKKISWDSCEESVTDRNCVIVLQARSPLFFAEFTRARKMKDQVTAKQVFTHNLKYIDIKSQLPSEAEVEAEDHISRLEGPSSRSYCHVPTSVEVFSVLVFSDDNDIDIHGTVKLIDSIDESSLIFKGSDQLSTQRRSLTLQSPPTMIIISDGRFKIDVSLKDGKNRVVGEGICEWNQWNIDSFFDRHLCTVFKGDNAYAVVHYSIFRRSGKATIAVSFVGKDIPQVTETSQVRVCGSITAEYGSYEYSTLYDQQNYKCTLFSRSENECCELQLGSILELSKSFVAFPSKDTLIFDVDLKVGVGVDQKFEGIKQVVEFIPFRSDIYALEIGNYTFCLWVDWTDGSYPKPFTYPNFSDMRSLRKLMPKSPFKV